MGISNSFGMSFAKSQFASKNNIPLEGKLFISLTNKEFAKDIGESFEKLGFEIHATDGTHKALEKAGIKSTRVLKISEGRPNIDDMIKNGEIALAINTSDNSFSSKSDATTIRQSVLANNVPYFTTIAAASAAAMAIEELKKTNGELEPKALQDYLTE